MDERGRKGWRDLGALVFKEEVVLQAQRAGRRQKSRAQIPERIAVFLDRNRGFHVHEVRLEQNRDA